MTGWNVTLKLGANGQSIMFSGTGHGALVTMPLASTQPNKMIMNETHLYHPAANVTLYLPGT